MTSPEAPALVIGVGNVLLRDDGVGVRVLEALRTEAAHDPMALPADTRLLDGGTLGLDLLRTVSGARSLLLVDAVDLRQEPGTVSVLRDDAIAEAAGRWGASAPGGVGELLAVARLMGWLPDAVALIGIQVDETGAGIGLSPSVLAAVPLAVAAALHELRELEGATA